MFKISRYLWLALLATSIMLAAFSYLMAERYTRSSDRSLNNFQSHAAETITIIQHALSTKIEGLRAIQDHALQAPLSRSAFTTQATSKLERLEGIQALEWIPQVYHNEREQYEEQAQRDGLEGFEFKEKNQQGIMVTAGKRDVYYPVYFLEPLESNKKALGFDLGSNTKRLAAINRALEKGTVTVSSRIRLVQEKWAQNGILVFIPHLRSKPKHLSGNEQKNAVNTDKKGLFLGVFRIGDMINSAIMGKTASDLVIRIYDVDDLNETTPIVSINEPTPTDAPLEEFQQGIFLANNLEIGNRTWRVVIKPGSPIGTTQSLSIKWFAVSLVLILFWALAFILYSVISHTREIREVSYRQQRQNEHLTAVIDNTLYSIITINTEGIILSFNKSAQNMFGYTPDEVIGKNVNILMPEPTRTEHDGYLQRYLMERKPHVIGSGRDVTAMDKAGNPLELHLGLSEMMIGSKTCFIGSLTDISDKKQLGAMRSQITSLIHDELKPLMSDVNTDIEMLAAGLDNQLDEKNRQILANAKDAIKKASGTMIDIEKRLV